MIRFQTVTASFNVTTGASFNLQNNSYACSFEPDLLPQYVKYDNPNYLRTRIKLGVCELCGENTDDICMHHVKSLKSIKADNEWNTIMLAKRRKTLAVCPNCYAKITK